MPQIKYSGLVTDIKGKAGGSVFASNRQGSYFRNNKWGGGRKSARWNRAKNNLAFLSSQWKALTSEQRDAWNAAAVNFPFYNKFKVEYTPSGYQLFMSLQGNLLANSLPLIDTPSNPRPAPKDYSLLSSVPDQPWVTHGTGATFPNAIGAGNTGCYGTQTACPICYRCDQGICVPDYPDNFAEMQVCQDKYDGFLVQVEPNACSTDQDCYDQGLGTGNDIECQNGECIYVGDGFLNWNQYAYGLNIGSILFDGGDWSEVVDDTQTQIVGSFRIALGANSKRLIQTTQDDVILISNYQVEGMGLDIRLRQLEQGITRMFIKLGVKSTDTTSTYGSFVWYFDFQTTEFMSNTVIQFYINPAKTQTHKIAVGNSGWLPFQFGYYDNLITDSSNNWGDFTGTNSNPFATWAIKPQNWGIVYGAGLYGLMTDNVYSDMRWWVTNYRDALEPVVGYLNGFESIVILANGDAKPKCNFENGCNDLQGVCKGSDKCICRHNICGYWGQRETVFRNAAPGGDLTIGCWPQVPIYSLNTPGNYDDGATFEGTWMQLDGGYFGSNGATFNPNAIIDVSSISDSGWALAMFMTKPKSIGSTFYEQEFIYSTTFSLGVGFELNLWDYIKAAVANVPLGSEVEIGFKLLDTDNGHYAQAATGGRFKAGAYLSSSVN